MDKNLHDIDELFRAGLEDYEATPTTGVKESIDASLAKKEAEEYKKRFIAWKRAALLLLLLLAGFVLYESGIIRKGNSHYTASNPAPGKNIFNTDKDTATNQDKNTLVKSDKNDFVSDNSTAPQSNLSNQQQILPITISPVTTDNRFTTNKTAAQKNSYPNSLLNKFIQKQDPLFSITASQPDKKTNTVSSYNDDLQTTEPGIGPLDERISIAKAGGRLVKNISLLQPPAVSYSPLFASRVNNAGKNKFKPFWTLAPFASSEKAGYRLDSDLPDNITTIKHREAHEPSFSTGAFVTYQFAKHWGLQSGVVYSNTQIGISPQKMYAFQTGGDVSYKYVTSSGYAYIKPGFGTPPVIGDSLTTTEAKHTLQYISVPLVIKHKVGNKKLSFIPGAGIEANFLTSAKVETEIKDASNLEIVTLTKLKGTKLFYWSVVAEAELQYSIDKKVLVSLRPAFRYAISPITKNNVVETFPRSFGIGLGIKIKL